jgi:hypothetical protein
MAGATIKLARYWGIRTAPYKVRQAATAFVPSPRRGEGQGEGEPRYQDT